MRNFFSFYWPHLLLVLVISAVVIFVFDPWKERIPAGYSMDALGGSWTVTEVGWAELDGKWRVETVVYPRKVRLAADTQKVDLLKSLCGRILTQWPFPPRDQHIGRNGLYRLSINVMFPKEKDGELEQMFEQAMPIPVFEGTCRSQTDWGKIYARYPNELMNWTIGQAELNREGDTATFQFDFDPLEEDAERGVFPFQKACNAVLNDPIVRFPNAETGEKYDPEAHLKFKRVIIRKRTSGGDYGLVSFGTFVGFAFNIAGGLCVDGVQLDA